MHICFFTKHQTSWGSSRERVGVYLDYLAKRGHTYKVISCIPDRLSRIWIGDKRGNPVFTKAYSFWHARVIKNLKLIWIIILARRFDIIFIQKLNLMYPLVRILSLRNKNIIFDFDDLCFSIRDKLSAPKILKLYGHIIAGNNYLAQIAKTARGQESVTVITTAIDCDFYTFSKKWPSTSSVVIGWAGSGENHLRHLELLIWPLRELAEKYDFIFKLVGAMHSQKIKRLFGFLGNNFVSIDWVQNAQLPGVIQTFDIGVMPLRDDMEARGKCGFKALQYMASGVAAVISPVGVNAKIIQDGVNGFLANDRAAWVERLSLLIEDFQLRNRLAANARKTIEEAYSLKITSQALAGILEKL